MSSSQAASIRPDGLAAPAASAAGQPGTAEVERTYRKVFWRIVPFLMLCYVVAYPRLGRNRRLRQAADVDGSRVQRDRIRPCAGVFFIGYFLFELPSNILMHKLGARIWIARIMITWGLLSTVFVFVKTPAQFYVLRFLLGLAEAGFYPGVILYLTYWFPSHRRAKIIAVFMSAIPVSGIFGNPLSGWIMKSFPNNQGLAGWQWMFLIEAIPAIAIGIATILYLDNGIANAKWLGEREKRLLTDDIAAQQQEITRTHSLGAVFRDPRTWWMSLIYFAFVTGQYGLTFWMPTLVKSTGVTGSFNIGSS